MNDQLKRHVDDILANIESAGTLASNTDEQEPTQFIDIHIYETVDEQEPQPTVESTLEDALTTPPKARRRFPLVGLALLCFLIVIAISVFYLQPLFAPSATVTIIPVTKQVSLDTTIIVVPGTTHTDQQQIPGRVLPTITMSQQQTSTTTGTVHQEAKSAHGTVTFYNTFPTIQIIPAGELLTGADGIQLVTDLAAVIPAGQLATNGQTTIPAHVLTPGSGGNIAAHDIYGACCRAGILAASSTFTGGQEARTYQTVTQADLAALAAPLTTSIEQSVQATLQKQVHSDEKLITPLPCQATVKADHQPGDAATQVSVTVDDTCQGMTYTSQTFHDLVNTLVTQRAGKQLGTGYVFGAIQTGIVQVTQKNGQVALQVHSVGVGEYQITQEQQTYITSLIAGKSKTQAITTLLHVPGVQRVSITIKGNNTILPTDIRSIHILLMLFF